MTKRRVLIAGLIALALAGGAVWLRSAQRAPEAAPKALPAVSVRASAAVRGDIQSWVFADGTARSVRREYLLFQNAGRVTFLKQGLREGSKVRAGELLARQDQRQFKADVAAVRAALAEAQAQQPVAAAELRQAETERELAQKKFERFGTLLAKESASQQEYDQARAELSRSDEAIARAESRIKAVQTQIEAAQARHDQATIKLEETTLVAPIDGVVAYVNINKGGYFMPSIVRTDSEQAALRTVPVVLIAPGRFEIAASVPSYERGRLRIGQRAVIVPGGERTPRDAGVRGRVHSVTPGINPGGRAIEVKIRADASAAELRDGMFVTAWIATDARENAVLAPLDAFVYRDNRPFVFVVDPQTQLVAERAVELGLQGFDAYEVRSGVQAGDLLVTQGRFQLSHGVRVRVLEAP